MTRAAKLLGIPWDHSEPGQPKNNSIAEAFGGVSVSTLRACCVTAGFLACFWSFVAPTAAVHRNAWVHEDGNSAHFERFREEFKGQSIVAGQLVWFRPAVTKYKLAKAMPRLQPGVFIGYEQQQGCKLGCTTSLT